MFPSTLSLTNHLVWVNFWKGNGMPFLSSSAFMVLNNSTNSCWLIFDSWNHFGTSTRRKPSEEGRWSKAFFNCQWQWMTDIWQIHPDVWMTSGLHALLLVHRLFFTPTITDVPSDPTPVQSFRFMLNSFKVTVRTSKRSSHVACNIGTRSKNWVSIVAVSRDKYQTTRQRCLLLHLEGQQTSVHTAGSSDQL